MVQFTDCIGPFVEKVRTFKAWPTTKHLRVVDLFADCFRVHLVEGSKLLESRSSGLGNYESLFTGRRLNDES